MKTYVSTLGFHETRVNRPLLRHGLDDDDVVVLVRPASDADTDRGEDAVAYVEDMLNEIAPGAEVVVERIDHTDFETAVLECSDVLRSVDGELVVNFGGGAREVFLPLTVAAILHAPEISTALQYTDIDQSVREWTIPNISAHVPESNQATLEVIEARGPDVSIPELHDHLDVSKSTVSRHVANLDESGLVETSMEGKTKHAAATFAGRLKLRVLAAES